MERRLSATMIVIAALVAAAVAGCTANQQILESANNGGSNKPDAAAANSAPAQQTGLERDLRSLRDADFNFIYIFRRIDGGTINAEDKRLMNENTPPAINRRLLSDDERAIVAGSNFRYPPESLKALSERFTIEERSKPLTEVMPSAANTDPDR